MTDRPTLPQILALGPSLVSQELGWNDHQAHRPVTLAVVAMFLAFNLIGAATAFVLGWLAVDGENGWLETALMIVAPPLLANFAAFLIWKLADDFIKYDHPQRLRVLTNVEGVARVYVSEPIFIPWREYETEVKYPSKNWISQAPTILRLKESVPFSLEHSIPECAALRVEYMNSVGGHFEAVRDGVTYRLSSLTGSGHEAQLAQHHEIMKVLKAHTAAGGAQRKRSRKGYYL